MHLLKIHQVRITHIANHCQYGVLMWICFFGLVSKCIWFKYFKRQNLYIFAILTVENLNLWFQCGNMAREGLRTLVVAKKTLTEEQYFDFEVSASWAFQSAFQLIYYETNFLLVYSYYIVLSYFCHMEVADNLAYNLLSQSHLWHRNLFILDFLTLAVNKIVI